MLSKEKINEHISKGKFLHENAIRTIGENKRFMLFISPYETASNQWEIMFFDTQENLEDYKNNHRDLTKEHYWLTIDEVVEIIQKSFEDNE